MAAAAKRKVTTKSRSKRKTRRSSGAADKVARGALAALIGVAAVAVLFAFEVPGMAATAAGEAMGSAGLRVAEVEVKGAAQMDDAPVRAIASRQVGEALPLVDVGAVRQDLLAFPYVHDARVSRRFPDTLVVDIVERAPAALWQGEGRMFLIDEEGVVLERIPVAELPDLPLLIGSGANREYAQLTRLLDRVPTLRPQLASARWVGERRWDLNVQSGEIIALPEGERPAGDALVKFVEMDRKAPMLGLGVDRYDLRLPGKAIARSPMFQEAREEAAKAETN